MREWTFDESDNGREVTVADGDIITIELPDNQTTGFDWVADTSADDVLTLRERRFHPPANTGPGTAGRLRLVYRVHSAGSTTIALARRRPWEPAEASGSEFSLSIHAL